MVAHDPARGRRRAGQHGQRVLGHEHASTTLQLYTRRTPDHEQILKALDDDDDDDLCQPVR
ncbi:hypothetical protein ACFV4N_14860 [Actinosynnema sp. NPDC059797]